MLLLMLASARWADGLHLSCRSVTTI